MRTNKKPKQLKIISILIFVTLSFVATLFYIFLKDIQIVPILLKEYIDSGNSIFIPYISYINVFWFLPEKNQVIRLSIGQLLDLIIIYNIISYIETNTYHYIKFSIFNGNFQNFNYVELNFNKYKEKNCAIFQNPEEFLDLENESRYNIEDIVLNSTKKKCKLNDKKGLLNNQLKNFRYKINIIRNRLYRKDFVLISANYYKNLRISLIYSVFKAFWIFRPKNNYCLPFKKKYFTFFNIILHLEGSQS